MAETIGQILALFSEPNKIYKITRDIDLQGGTLTLPEGCTLDFLGGSFSNGSVVGNNTSISANIIKIFNDAILIKGKWNIEATYPEWFGICGTKEIDDSMKIQKAIDFFQDSDIEGGCVVLSNTYYLSKPVKIIKGIYIKGCSQSTIPNKAQIITNSNFESIEYTQNINNNPIVLTINSLFYCIDKCKISQISFQGRATEFVGAKSAIMIPGLGMGQIDHCYFNRFENCGIWSMGSTEDFTISDNRFTANGISIRCGIYLNYIEEDGTYNLYKDLYKGNNDGYSKRGGSVNLVKIINNYILYGNIGIYIDGGYDITIDKTCTSRNTIAGIIFNSVNIGRIINSYTEEDGVATYFYPNESTILWGDNQSDDLPVSPILRERKLDGVQLNDTENIRAIYILNDCSNCTIENNSVSFRKRRKITDNSVNLDQINYCGVDALCCLIGTTIHIRIASNKYYQPKSDSPEIEKYNSIQGVICSNDVQLDGLEYISDYVDNRIYTTSIVGVKNTSIVESVPINLVDYNDFEYQFLNSDGYYLFPHNSYSETLEEIEQYKGIPLFKVKNDYNANIQYVTNYMSLNDKNDLITIYMVYKNLNDDSSFTDKLGNITLLLYDDSKELLESKIISANDITSYGYNYGIIGAAFHKTYKNAKYFRVSNFIPSSTEGIKNYLISPFVTNIKDNIIIPLYDRPKSPKINEMFFDSALNKPIWWTGSKWIISDGLDADSTGWSLIE